MPGQAGPVRAAGDGLPSLIPVDLNRPLRAGAGLRKSLALKDADALERRDLALPCVVVLWCVAAGFITDLEAARAWNAPRRVAAMLDLTQACEQRLQAHFDRIWKDWGGVGKGSMKSVQIEQTYDDSDLVIVRYQQGVTYRMNLSKAPAELRPLAKSAAETLAWAAGVATGEGLLQMIWSWEEADSSFRELGSRAAVEKKIEELEKEDAEDALRYFQDAGAMYDSWKAVQTLKGRRPAIGTPAARKTVQRFRGKARRWTQLIESAERLKKEFSKSGETPFAEYEDEGVAYLERGGFLSLVKGDEYLHEENVAMMDGTGEWPTTALDGSEAHARAVLRHLERMTAAEAVLSRWC